MGSCCSEKAIAAYIPFSNQNIIGGQAITFLNGFEISSVNSSIGYLTPFEVQIVVNKVTSQGISILLESTSATQVYSIFVSYIVYDSNIQNLVAGIYVYDQYIPTLSLQFTPPIGISNNNGAFHGFSGFIIRNNQQNFQITGNLINGNLTFSTISSLYYLSYSYFFLIGGPCGQCPGYSISYNGNCISTCPPNSYLSQSGTCVTCQSGQIWNGTACVNRCNGGRNWDSFTQTCICPTGLNWNGLNCISCQNGQIWNSNTNQCVCPIGANWNGYLCISCTSGQIWSSQYLSCQCP